MGYQESYLKLTAKDEYIENQDLYNQDFNKVLAAIKKNGYEYFSEFFLFPQMVLEFKNDHFPFKAGEKAIYITGDRGFQRTNHFILGLVKADGITEIPYEEMTDEQKNLFSMIEMVYTEEVSSDGIWDNVIDKNDADVCMPFTSVFPVLNEEEKQIYDEFKEVISDYLEWKKREHNETGLNEKEKKKLKEKFIDKFNVNESKYIDVIEKFGEWPV